MTGEARKSLWRERLDQLAASGLTQKQWCEQNGVPAHQLAYWKRRLAGAESAETSGGGFDWCPIQLIPEAGPMPSGLEVRVGAAHIQVGPGFDPALLAGVVRALAKVTESGSG